MATISLKDASAITREIQAVESSGIFTPVRVQATSKGIDYSSGLPGSFAGFTLIRTIASNAARLGYFIQVQDANYQLVVAFDDTTPAPSVSPSILILDSGFPGGFTNMEAMPHSGRIRIYSINGSCRFSAREW